MVLKVYFFHLQHETLKHILSINPNLLHYISIKTKYYSSEIELKINSQSVFHLLVLQTLQLNPKILTTVENASLILKLTLKL